VLVDPNDCTYALPNTPSAPPVVQGAPANPIKSAGDGINVEILSGVTAADKIKIPDNAGPAEPEMAGGGSGKVGKPPSKK